MTGAIVTSTAGNPVAKTLPITHSPLLPFRKHLGEDEWPR